MLCTGRWAIGRLASTRSGGGGNLNEIHYAGFFVRLALVVIWVVENGEGGADDAVAFQGQVSVVDERWGDLSPAAVGLFYEVVSNAEFNRPEFSDRADGVLVRGCHIGRALL